MTGNTVGRDRMRVAKGFAVLVAALLVQSCITRDAEPRSAEREQQRTEREQAPATKAQTQQCLADLAAAGAQFDVLPDRNDGGGCSIEGAVQLRSVRGDAGTISLSNLGPLECDAALTFAKWSRYGAGRAATQIMDSPLARVETFGTYSCRNVAGSNRRSGHARARAIDVSAFRLENGRRISVSDDWDRGDNAAEFLRIVHRSACRRFATVLGPDYNQAHDDHFHFETGTGQFCR